MSGIDCHSHFVAEDTKKMSLGLPGLEEAELGVEVLIAFCLQEKTACLPPGYVLPRIKTSCGGKQ